MTTDWLWIGLFLVTGACCLLDAWRTFTRIRPSPERAGLIAWKLAYGVSGIAAGALILAFKLSDRLARETGRVILAGMVVHLVVTLFNKRIYRWGERWHQAQAAGNPDYLEDEAGNIARPAGDDTGGNPVVVRAPEAPDETIETWEDLVRAQRARSETGAEPPRGAWGQR